MRTALDTNILIRVLIADDAAPADQSATIRPIASYEKPNAGFGSLLR